HADALCLLPERPQDEPAAAEGLSGAGWAVRHAVFVVLLGPGSLDPGTVVRPAVRLVDEPHEPRVRMAPEARPEASVVGSPDEPVVGGDGVDLRARADDTAAGLGRRPDRLPRAEHQAGDEGQ